MTRRLAHFKRPFGTPAESQPLQHAKTREIAFAAPLRERLRSTGDRNQVIAALVVCLHAAAYPSAIAWRVWAVIVDSVDRVRRGWTRAHVPPKRSKVAVPFVADRDSATSIRWILRVRAALAKVGPDCVFREMRHAMRAISGINECGPEASTATARASLQAERHDSRLSAAVALANPRALSAVLDWSASNHCQQAIAMSGKVFGHSRFYFKIQSFMAKNCMSCEAVR